MTVVVGGVDAGVVWIMCHLKINKTNNRSFSVLFTSRSILFILSKSYCCFSKLKVVPQKSKSLCDNADWH